MGISRRVALGSIGQSAAFGALAASLSAQLRAAQPSAAPAPAAGPAPTYCLSMIYRQAEGAAFDGNMFRDQHIPVLKKAFGTSLDRIELRLPMPTPEGAPPPQIIATTNFWFHDIAEFVKRTKASANEVNASLANITKAPVMGQIDQVLMTLGDERPGVPVDSLCLSNYFPAKEGATFDTKYFVQTYFPKMAELYGPNAIRRIELTSGAAAAAGGKVSLLNSAHIYIRDNAAYITASANSDAKLNDEVQKYTNIQSVSTLTRIHAAG